MNPAIETGLVDEDDVNNTIRHWEMVTGQSLDELEPDFREVMAFCGDQIGVNLRGASNDLVREFMMRFLLLLLREAAREPDLTSSQLDDVMDDVLLQAVTELFGGADRAS